MKCLTAVSMVHRFGFTDLCELHNQLHSQPHYQPISAKEFNRRIELESKPVQLLANNKSLDDNKLFLISSEQINR